MLRTHNTARTHQRNVCDRYAGSRKPEAVAGVVACLAIVACLGLSAVLEGSSTATAAATSGPTSVPAVADATVAASSPRANYGDVRRWTVDARAGHRRRVLLKFRVPAPPVGQLVTAATLRARSENAGSGVRVYATSPSWRESRVTWQNAPVRGAYLGSHSAYAAGSWLTWDVTRGLSQAVRSRGGTVSLTLTGRQTRRLRFDSRETGRAGPRLVVRTSTSGGEPVPGPHGVPGNWTLAFSDEFGGTQLDLTKWQPNWLGASDSTITKPVNSSELSCYDPAQVHVGGGALSLTAEARACTTGNGKTYRYASGLVQSRRDFTYTYGFAEARMYLPPNSDPSNGAVGSCGPNWPAFWVNGSGATVGEIDVMECLGDNTRWSYHWDDYHQSATALPPGWEGTMPATADGWHTFGVNWQPGSLDFYYDGVLVGQQTEGVTSDPHYLIANLGISGTQVATPQTVKVDYIRVWQ